jgi:putative oxidoreductase
MTSISKSVDRGTQSNAVNSILWAVQVLSALIFAVAGSNKLLGKEMAVQMFSVIGLGQWLRYLTGTLEIVGSILLLTPSLSGIGAILLALTMVGAILTILFTIGGNPATLLALFALMSCVAYGRKDRTLRLIQHVKN